MAKAPALLISHWPHLISELQASPLDFFSSVEEAIKRRQIPGAKTSRVTWPEGDAFSTRRQYLRVRRGKLVLDLCAAPFGTGFFVSWWLGELRGWMRLIIAILLPLVPILGWQVLFKMFGMSPLSVLLLSILMLVPLGGWLVLWRTSRPTYYRIDTALMFRSAVHNAILEVIDQLTQAKGLRALTEFERKPILRELYRR